MRILTILLIFATSSILSQMFPDVHMWPASSRRIDRNEYLVYLLNMEKSLPDPSAESLARFLIEPFVFVNRNCLGKTENLTFTKIIELYNEQYEIMRKEGTFKEHDTEAVAKLKHSRFQDRKIVARVAGHQPAFRADRYAELKYYMGKNIVGTEVGLTFEMESINATTIYTAQYFPCHDEKVNTECQNIYLTKAEVKCHYP
ncbi:unnamed protein product [Caenorhabditis angaria]|uniref:Uncharacterized protein n=1 Tax=Caenorhabditis angaria TaxID=860376 RepID=A0A9P1MXF9_9PELO|nr:unnamed protein product [Caenorhabditis angaria]